MSTAYVIVEDRTDTELLQALLLPEVVERVRIHSTGSKPSIPSYARSVLDLRQRPVAVVMDSDSTESESVLSQKREVEELLRMQSLTIPFTVVMAVPCVEVILFSAPKLLERMFGTTISDETLSEARRDPRRVLLGLDKQLNTAVTTAVTPPHLKDGEGAFRGAIAAGAASLLLARCLRELTPDDVEEMQKHPVVRELNKFLTSVTAGQLQPA